MSLGAQSSCAQLEGQRELRRHPPPRARQGCGGRRGRRREAQEQRPAGDARYHLTSLSPRRWDSARLPGLPVAAPGPAPAPGAECGGAPGAEPSAASPARPAHARTRRSPPMADRSLIEGAEPRPRREEAPEWGYEEGEERAATPPGRNFVRCRGRRRRCGDFSGGPRSTAGFAPQPSRGRSTPAGGGRRPRSRRVRPSSPFPRRGQGLSDPQRGAPAPP